MEGVFARDERGYCPLQYIYGLWLKEGARLRGRGTGDTCVCGGGYKKNRKGKGKKLNEEIRTVRGKNGMTDRRGMGRKERGRAWKDGWREGKKNIGRSEKDKDTDNERRK